MDGLKCFSTSIHMTTCVRIIYSLWEKTIVRRPKLLFFDVCPIISIRQSIAIMYTGRAKSPPNHIHRVVIYTYGMTFGDLDLAVRNPQYHYHHHHHRAQLHVFICSTSRIVVSTFADVRLDGSGFCITGGELHCQVVIMILH